METFSLMMAGSEDWLTLDEAAAYLAKSSHWLYQNRMKLRIPHSQIGKTYRFKKSQLDEWIRDSAKNHTSPSGNRSNLKKISL